MQTVRKQKTLNVVLAAMLGMLFISILTLPALAGPKPDHVYHPEGGFSGPASIQGFQGPGPDIKMVAEVLNMADDSRVALQGHIVQYLGGKHYVFQDASGSINVKIGKKHWQGRQFTPNDKVLIYGEVDKEWFKTEVEVKNLMKAE